MPAPSRTSIDQIVAEGRRIVEDEGLEGLTMQKVAEAVGVRAPSLYKHLTGRGELVRLVIEAVLAELRHTLESAVAESDPDADLASLARAFRGFARRHPEAYRALFAPLPEEWRPAREMLVAASAPVLRITEELCGPERALDAARLVTAWAHGFMMMELSGAFRMGGDLETAFEFGVVRLGEALAR